MMNEFFEKIVKKRTRFLDSLILDFRLLCVLDVGYKIL